MRLYDGEGIYVESDRDRRLRAGDRCIYIVKSEIITRETIIISNLYR